MFESMFNEMTLWLLGTAVVFTFVGRWMFWKENIEDIVDSTLQSLIDQGYIKMEGDDIVKWQDWCRNND